MLIENLILNRQDTADRMRQKRRGFWGTVGWLDHLRGELRVEMDAHPDASWMEEEKRRRVSSQRERTLLARLRWEAKPALL